VKRSPVPAASLEKVVPLCFLNSLAGQEKPTMIANDR
jgi:hypothetical protein